MIAVLQRQTHSRGMGVLSGWEKKTLFPCNAKLFGSLNPGTGCR